MNIRVKSVYADRNPEDGYKVLVDDFLPASMNENMAGVDLWMSKISPSEALKKLFSDMPDKWEEFKAGYAAELDKNKGHLVEVLMRLSHEDGVTLFYSTSDPEHNVAVALRDYIVARAEAGIKKAA